jgi:hypothetical protein
MTINKIDILLGEAIKLIPPEKLPELPNNMFGYPQKHKYERDIWKIGEEIRQLLLTDKKAELSAEQIEQVLSIINNPTADRGRQSLIWLLGKRKYAHFAPKIIKHIYDDNVSLHIFDTIYKMRAMGYEKEILDFAERFKPLAADRRKIARYLNSFQ